jgi:hypothetical protein
VQLWCPDDVSVNSWNREHFSVSGRVIWFEIPGIDAILAVWLKSGTLGCPRETKG